MRIKRFLPLLALAALVPLVSGDDKPAPAKNKTYEIPYRLTLPKHIAVRVKINGKGPFNLILDTGAPALILATKAAKKAGVEADGRGWATLDKLEIEGGLKMPKTPARIETPFQLEGMNGMGLAGMEIHGLMGYQALAKYKMEIDLTKHKMLWTELDYNPASPKGMGGKGGGGAGGLEVMGAMMKTLGSFLGRRSAPEVTLRGFHGMALADGDDHPKVESVLEKGPAGAAGLRKGDVVKKFNARTVTNVADVMRIARGLPPGKEITLSVERGGEAKEIKVTTGEGI